MLQSSLMKAPREDPRVWKTRERMMAMTPEARKAFAMTGVEARRKKYPPMNKEQRAESRRRKRTALRRNAIEAYGGACACCQETTYEFLTIDHINGGGRQHRISLNGNFYRWLNRNNFPGGFQVLCYNCNCCKGAYGACVHTSIS